MPTAIPAATPGSSRLRIVDREYCQTRSEGHGDERFCTLMEHGLLPRALIGT
jgi:hypothetical protein